jgi:hypothetical protein
LPAAAAARAISSRSAAISAGPLETIRERE